MKICPRCYRSIGHAMSCVYGIRGDKIRVILNPWGTGWIAACPRCVKRVASGSNWETAYAHALIHIEEHLHAIVAIQS